MATDYRANYTGIDQQRYNEGNKFYSQDPYLQGTGLNKAPITFNPSNSNTGIISQYGNNSLYGNQGSDSMGSNMPTGSFNQKDNLFEIGPNTNMQPNVYDEFGKNGQVYNNSLGQNINNLAGKAGNYGLRALAAQSGSQGGAMLGSMLPGGILSMILGAGAGGKFGFDASGRGPTDPERITANFYGNQGNSPMQYLDEEGNLVDSMMQGYGISSRYGKGIAGSLQGRIDTINKTISNPNYRGQLKVRRDGEKSTLDKLIAEQKALDAAKQTQIANRTANERSVLDDYFGGSTAGADQGRFDGAASSAEYSADPTSFSGTS